MCVGNVWAIEMQLNQSFFAVEWPVESMRGPIPFLVESTAVESTAVESTAVDSMEVPTGFWLNQPWKEQPMIFLISILWAKCCICNLQDYMLLAFAVKLLWHALGHYA